MNASAIKPCEIIFEKSVDFHRAVKRRHFSRKIRRECLLILPVGVIGILGVFGSVHRGESGAGFWLLIAFAIFPFASWAAYHWATGQIRAAGAPPRYTVRVAPESFTITNAQGNSTFKWSQITATWRYPDMFFIFWDKKTDLDHAFALPTASFGADLIRFIEDRVKENGGVVS